VNQLLHILLVEDTASDVRLTQEALKRSHINCTLTIVSDGVAAMEYLHDLKKTGKDFPNMILLDLNMPRKNGHEVLKEIDADSVLRNIPVILLTVSDNDQDVMEALKWKMNYYLSKPVTSEKLSVLIRSIYELHQDEHVASDSASHDEVHVKVILAGNPHTAAIALERLAIDPSQRVRRRVAENPNVPVPILSQLAEDSDVEVRQSIVENPSTPASLLESLAKDLSDDVRMSMATSHRTPTDILKGLANDDNIYVSSSAKKTLGAR
jgi:two-component system, chemotaxis family, response regulator Rcp1